ncbi:unnamed protein product [Phytophthora fragariaefolia]|uniref:Unnamed protein product n=1 Tax=Phytophthora fragariaefolia TaxID=1490495 RepID=A0A9W7CXJ9_9STRA|nr:unnamed protein product [Phytophthora fragariaefolia]
MGRSGAKVKKGGLGNALLRTQKKTSAINTKDVASSAGKHVSERDGGDASVALASTAWGEHFKAENIDYVFFSAKEAQDEIDEEAKKLRQEARNAEAHDEYDEVKPADAPAKIVDDVVSAEKERSPYPVLSRIELLEYVTKVATEVLDEVGVRVKDKGLIKLGMVGFPNVGKSSVINALLGASTYSHKTQRVAVGATPGKTKHFQSYARNRGYTTTGKGGPDTSRAARDILRHYVNGRLLYCHPPPNVSDPTIFDIHVLAKAQFPDLEEPIVPESTEDEGVEDEVSPSQDANAEEDLEFDTTVEDKRAVSKRLKKHGRKGRKGRDKNPYEDSDIPGGFSGVHINSGGKKKNRRP